MVHFGAIDDFAFTMTRGPNGTDVLIRGHSLDGTKLGGHGANGSSGGSSGSSGGASRTRRLSEGPFHLKPRASTG